MGKQLYNTIIRIEFCLILYLGIEIFNFLVLKKFLRVGNVGRHRGSLVQSALPKNQTTIN
jgi:hypothetical protein